MNRAPLIRQLIYDHGGERLTIELKRSRRKSLALHVYQDRPPEVRAPLRCPNREVDSFIRSRLDWIVRAREELRSAPHKVVPGYRQGEIRSYLGHDYLLMLRQGRPAGVEISGYYMLVTHGRITDEEAVRRTVHAYLKSRGMSYYPRRLDACYQGFKSLFGKPVLQVRKMKARWGSCSSSGVICLNSRLMEKPVAAIDFVITHELCHLRHFHHGKAFYRLLDRLMPDWRERERLLE